MHRLDLLSVMNITEIPCVVLTDTMEQQEILKILKCKGIKGVSGMLISEPSLDIDAFKNECVSQGIQMTSLESTMNFSDFTLNSDGLLPVIVQDYKNKRSSYDGLYE